MENNKKILIVDDVQANIEALKIILKDKYILSSTTDPSEVLELVNKDKPDMILLDIIMPEIDGYEVCKQIKAQEDTKNIPIIFITADTTTQSEEEGLKLGAVDYITKPIRPAIVKNRVKTQMQLYIYRQELEKQVEQRTKELVSKEKLLMSQSKMASLGEMLENIAHQWRQPLSVITVAASNIKLSNDLDTLTDEKLNESIDGIVSSGKFLSQTIDDFRSFYKDDKNVSNFNLSTIITKTLALLAADFKNKDIEVILKLKDVNITGYKNELIQAFLNIISNAKDALKDSNNKEKLIFITLEKNDDKAFITFKDNAGGIPSDNLSKIFDERFTTKADQNGTGIGLYMTNSIINKANGTVDVENVEYTYNDETYKGAMFTIMLPLK